MRKKLTDRQKKFVQEYLVDLNATQAAIRAGYSPKTADRIGAELLGKTWVAAAVAKRKKQLEAKTEITQEKVVKMMQTLFSVSAQKIPLIDRTGSQVTDSDGKPVFKLVDAQAAAKAVDMLSKYTGAYDADNRRELHGEISIAWGKPEDSEE